MDLRLAASFMEVAYTMEMNGLMGGLYRICEWIMRFSVTNVLWVLCAIPVFYLGLVMLVSETPDQVVSVMTLMAVLSPFLLFPSTAAMFTVVRKWVLGDVDVPLVKTFFRGYKENYLQSMVGGIIYTLLFYIMYVNYRFYLNMDNGLEALSLVFVVLAVVLAVSVFYFFSIMTHLHMKLLQIIKNSLILTIGRPVTSILIALTNVFIIVVSFRWTFLIPFFMGALIAYMTFFHFNRMFVKLQAKQQEYMEREAAGQEGPALSDGASEMREQPGERDMPEQPAGTDAREVRMNPGGRDGE